MSKCANCGQDYADEYLFSVEGTIEKPSGGKLKIIFSMCMICCINKGLVDGKNEILETMGSI